MLDTPNSLKPAFRIKNKVKPLDQQKLHNANALREELLRDMLALEAQRQQLELDGNAVDFAMLQSYREMIHSRRQLLAQLEHQRG
ncbi:MAG TPA: hypothetical protein VIN71_07990 [Pseudomonadales bacterium]